MEQLATLLTNIGDVADAITASVPKVVTTCALITALIPKPNGRILLAIYNAINTAALNIGKAKNQA